MAVFLVSPKRVMDVTQRVATIHQPKSNICRIVCLMPVNLPLSLRNMQEDIEGRTVSGL